MDLPTCPSCGQSVLDDDATDCPFCGASMSSAAKSKAAGGKPAPQKATPKKQPTNDDPFAIEQAPTSKKVVLCSRKPMKGRLHRVVCPMCDTQGFIPQAAIGRQVKCANTECLVPIFTASENGAEKPKAKVPARVSDDSGNAEKSITQPGLAKNPMVIYGIVAAVLFAATMGLVAYLNRPGTEFIPGGDIPTITLNEDESEELIGDDKPAETKVPLYRQRAIELVEIMISEATTSSGNRDKAICRRLTGDAYLRLGMPEQAEAEFEHMNKVASDSGRNTAYYLVVPLVSEYWLKFHSGETDSAAQNLAEANSLAPKIPTSGGVAFESGIALAAALANSGDIKNAVALIAGQQRDETVASQMDTVRLAAWSAISGGLQDLNKPSLPPLQVFSWNEPLMTAVAVNLAVMGRWDVATKWCESIDNILTASDTFAAVAEQMVRQTAPEAAQKSLQAAAVSKNSDIALRTEAVLARSTAANDRWTALSVATAALPSATPVSLNRIESLIDAKTPDIDASLLRGEALTDYIIAAISHGDSEAAGTGLNSLYATLTSAVPPTAIVRAAAVELDRNADKVQQRIATELRISGANQIRARFIAYRRSIDRILKAAETRRLHLLLMLTRVIQNGGLDAVRQVVTNTSTDLAKEVGVDDLNGLLFVAAADIDKEFAEMAVVNRKLSVPLARAEPAEEAAVIKALIAAWDGYLKASRLTAVDQLEAAPKARGLCAATTRYIVEKLIARATSETEAFAEISKIKNKLWREECLQASTRTLVRNKLLDLGKVRPSVSEAATNPSQRIAAFYGAVRGAIDLEQAEKP